LGRDAEENESLIRYAHPDDTIMQLADNLGPTAILKAAAPSKIIISQVAGLIQRFSRYKDHESVEAKYWLKKDKNSVHAIRSQRLDEQQITALSV